MIRRLDYLKSEQFDWVSIRIGPAKFDSHLPEVSEAPHQLLNTSSVLLLASFASSTTSARRLLRSEVAFTSERSSSRKLVSTYDDDVPNKPTDHCSGFLQVLATACQGCNFNA